MKKTIFFIAVTMLLACFIFYMSSQDSKASTDVSFGIIEWLSSRFNDIFGFSPDFYVMKQAEKILRKSAHFILYTMLGAFIMCVLCGLKKPTPYLWLTAVLITAIYAMTDEFHQLFVSGRSGELRDVLIDSSGGGLGSGMVYAFIKLKFSKIKERRKDNKY